MAQAQAPSPPGDSSTRSNTGQANRRQRQARQMSLNLCPRPSDLTSNRNRVMGRCDDWVPSRVGSPFPMRGHQTKSPRPDCWCSTSHGLSSKTMADSELVERGACCTSDNVADLSSDDIRQLRNRHPTPPSVAVIATVHPGKAATTPVADKSRRGVALRRNGDEGSWVSN